MGRVREIARLRRRVRVGAPDASLTAVSGMVAVTELVDRLDVIKLLDAAIGPIKARDRGFTGGQLLVGLAAAQLAGEDFLVGLDRQRADPAGQVLAPVAGLSSTTAAGLARGSPTGSGRRWRPGSATSAPRCSPRCRRGGPRRCAEVTIDLDTTDVEVYGRHKRGVAYNYQGQRCGRPHVATWARDRHGAGRGPDGRRRGPPRHAAELLRRALAALPAPARAGRIRLRADAGYFAGQLARAALFAGVEFAIGAKRIAPLWRILSGVAETDWVDAIDMDGAQVAVAAYCPDWWPATTRLLIRRVRLDVPRPGQRRPAVAAAPHPAPRPAGAAGRPSSPGRRRLRLLVHRDQPRRVHTGQRRRGRALVPAPDPGRERVPRRQARCRARHLPSGYPQVNRAWMWGALLAVSIAGWLHQLTATPRPDGDLVGHGVRDGQAMIATLRHRLIRVPARLVRHADALTLRLPPGYHLLEEVLARLRALPATS